MTRRAELVLFDLDGTLVDTAPDLAAAVNRMRAARGLAPLPLADLRSVASHGARGMIGRAFGIAPPDPEFSTLREEFFAEYEGALCVESSLFPGMEEALAAFDTHCIRWGIVTNKIARFTVPLMRALDLEQRAACIVSGDTAARPKPDPAPLLHALAATGVRREHALYVGDDLRDVQAGQAAGVRTVVARYGYLGDGPHYDRWGADYVIDTPSQLLALAHCQTVGQ